MDCCSKAKDIPATTPVHRKVTAVIVGAGNRGKNYARYAEQFPDLFQVVAVAEPREHARSFIQKHHSLPQQHCYPGWESLTTVEKLADCAIIATQDQQHLEPAVMLAKKGYHILLEKPMAVTEEDCRSIYTACKNAGVILAVCHVLRYHPPAKKLKNLIDSGIIGEVVNINHTEPVGFWHFAHSFVRGNWRNTKMSTFSLLAKCCHDVDLIAYWMGNKQCVKLSSFGSLHHFKKEKKPDGGGMYCLQCEVEAGCPYSAKKIYLDPAPDRPRWPMSVVCDIEDAPEGYMKKLKEAIENEDTHLLPADVLHQCVQNGKKNYQANLLVLQVVNFEFIDGATATLTMVAFSEQLCNRKTEVYGTMGQLVWDESKGQKVTHFDFASRTSKVHQCEETNATAGWGHGGADFFMMKAFVEAVARGESHCGLTDPEVCLETHLLTFAAEEARLTGSVVKPSEDPRWKV
ncbi:putative oxidoreductase YjhC [Chionoecetes opilio]|uniref:Putative oxidoreductase YjhC n=1 Tax=Chionoecetes opilio TaxID=41210 RepID=A0A8J4Y4Y0_CHIOP|nr:putative oxidoreductase YjhC [Chionoecetes opilio]